MKLVEVVSGLQTDADVAAAIFELSKRWGKTPVHARSTPGFIVNRIARPYYAEALALLHERFAEPATIDACLRGAGFRMGPCELMDLIGHDTNFAVTQSVFDANFGDKRYVPSLVQREMVDGGLLGRKSGRGFFAYGAAGAATPAPAAFTAAAGAARRDRRAARPRRRRRPLGGAARGGRRPLRGRPVEPLERPADRRRRAPPRPTAARRRRSLPTPAFATSPSSIWRSRPPAARPARRSRWRSPRPPRPTWREHARSGCASPAGTPQLDRRRARPGRRAHRRDADQRRRRRRPAGRLHARRRRPGDEARRQPSGRAVRVPRRAGTRSPSRRCSTSSTPTTAASAIASAPGCASAPGSRRSIRPPRKTASRAGVGRWRDRPPETPSGRAGCPQSGRRAAPLIWRAQENP